jgi:uncharacterized membrane protein YfcA
MDWFVLQLPDASAMQLLAIALAAFFASILGGLSGQGVGLILPVFMAPVVGIANVIPVMSISALITNLSRIAVFWREVNLAKARQMLLGALPAAILGATAFTWMNARWVAIGLGGFLILSIPLRRLLARADYRLGNPGLSAAGAGYGLVAGGMTGTGLLLLSVLMAAGVHGSALIATDATVSTVINLTKLIVFGSSSLYDAKLVIAGILIGLCTTPGAFVARWLMQRLSLKVHGAIMDAVVLAGGLALLWQALA